ncbi:MAG TPA: PH domain-containing protein [Pseudonocardiaceae bacterium]|nr:PH domain-containing protein [Pseudonocardiaceae bacterium]
MTTPEADLVAAPEVADVVAEAEWHRLEVRTVVVRPFNEFVGFIPLLIGAIALGQHNEQKIWYGLGVMALLLSRGLVHWLTTRYRITDEQVEIRSGLISRQRLATRRERIRTVESTAKFGHRLFGVTSVRIGTGQHEHKGHKAMKLDAVTTAEADRLRRVLLSRSEAAAGNVAPATVTEVRGVVLAKLDWRWLRYAPLTLSGLFAAAAIFGVVWRSVNELDINVNRIGLAREGVNWFEHASAGGVIAVVTLVAVVLIVFGSTAIYVLKYTGYLLTREPDDTLHVRRGLLTTSAVTIEEARLRGVEIREPLLLRAGRGARCSAVATGLQSRNESHLLMPPGPAVEAHRVASRALRLPDGASPTQVRLAGHPRGALRRRLIRAVVPALLVVFGLWFASAVAGWPVWLWHVACALPVLAVPLGLNRYRNLGHALTPRYLVSRLGSLERRTVALERTGIIGWQVRRTFFQRRVGLITLTAATSAGRSRYRVLDITEADGLRLAEDAVPGLLTPFLVED